jgi:2-polyprenyl-3-methyl-5-hydroxy-6-metoxy-1,4-benzoquinol methylase
LSAAIHVQDQAPQRLEHVVCNLCGADKTRPFMRRQGYSVVACESCDLVYVSPRATLAALAQHYNGNESSRIQYYLDGEPADRRSFAPVLERLERLQPAKGQLLDVGPNVGSCLALARERGWQVAGIEINAEAARYCRETRGLEVRAGTLEDEPFPPATFDAVLMGDVIEHLPDPRQALVQVRALLKPGGMLLISTPDIAGWAGRALQVKPEEHIYYFSPRTMKAMLEQAGYEVVEITPFDRHHNITAMVHSTTFGGLFQTLAPFFRLARRIFGDVILRLPIKENLLAIARRPLEVAQART